LKAILCTTSTKQLHNAYYKNYSQLAICVQAANLSDCRIESNFFLPELECSTPHMLRAGIVLGGVSVSVRTKSRKLLVGDRCNLVGICPVMNARSVWKLEIFDLDF